MPTWERDGMDVALALDAGLDNNIIKKIKKEGVMKKLFTGSIIVLVILCFMQATSAEASYSGTRTYSSGQLMADDEWANGWTSMSFNVTQLEDDYWQYDYTFTYYGYSSYSDPMNFLKLQVSENVPGAEYYYIDEITKSRISLTPSIEYFHLWDADAEDPCFYLYCLYIGPDTNTQSQLDDARGTTNITFVSTQAPMWGSFYARGPHNDPPEMTNTGFPNSFGTTTHYEGSILVYDYTGPSAPTFNGSTTGAEYNSWILVPDTVTTTPEPTTLLLLGLGLIGLAGVRRRMYK